MTEIERKFKAERQQWLEDAHMKEDEMIFRDREGREYVLIDTRRCYIPYELTSVEAYKEVVLML